MLSKLLNTCKILWLIVLILLAIIFIVIEICIMFGLTINDINSFVSAFSNLTLAICAFVALTGWKRELKQKRQFDIIDELLTLIIKAQTFIKEDFIYYRIGLEDSEQKKLNIPYVNRKALLYGKNFELLYSKLLTVQLQTFMDKTKEIASQFYHTVKTEHGYTGFYQACMDKESGFLANTQQKLSDLRTLCEEKVRV